MRAVQFLDLNVPMLLIARNAAYTGILNSPRPIRSRRMVEPLFVLRKEGYLILQEYKNPLCRLRQRGWSGEATTG